MGNEQERIVVEIRKQGDAMIITQTPLRISFVGGGTDLPEYYRTGKVPGRVISATIDKYVYVMVNQKFDGKIRVSYSETENVDTVDDIKHDIVRNTMKMYGLEKGFEIVTVADIPGVGTGLGSSSSLTVGLIKAFDQIFGLERNDWEIAEMACRVELDMCKKAGGKQDQYAATFGGFNQYTFDLNGFGEDMVYLQRMESGAYDIEKYLMLFYIGPRKVSGILEDQTEKIERNRNIYDAMSDLAYQAKEGLETTPESIGQLLDINWEYKRHLADGISNPEIQQYVVRAFDAGAGGAKVLGQGGGGFLLVSAPTSKHNDVQRSVGLAKVPFKFSNYGSKVIYG